jgi:hypothetical protein
MAADLQLRPDLDFWEVRPDPMFPRSRSGRIKPCPHCQARRRAWLIGIIAALSILAGVVSAMLTRPAPAYQSTTTAQLASYSSTVGNRMLNAAETKTGDWYSYGATGPSFFDCSGLVYWSAGHIGLKNWPRDTFSLIAAVASGRLSYTSHPQRGDLAFFGTGHVEFVTIWYHTTFGAHKSGTQVGWRSYDPRYYGPTFFLHINW